MFINSLELTNFRNFSRVGGVELPAEGLLVAAAPNASGKTNFIEALAVLLRGKSFRAKTDDCVQWGKGYFAVKGSVGFNNNERHEVAVRYSQARRLLKIEEDSKMASVVSFYAKYPLVMFLPEDALLLARGPVGRRNYLNQSLVVHKAYLSALVQYHRALKQRNFILKKAKTAEQVQPWSEALENYAKILSNYRRQFLEAINTRVNEAYCELAGERIGISVGLQEAGDGQALGEKLKESFLIEKRYGYTLYGPHRDDVVVEIDGRPGRVSFSRGQARMLAVVLKICARDYIKTVTGEQPVFLLDDVLSELDERRQNNLLEQLGSGQIIITGTGVGEAARRRQDAYFLDVREMVGRAEEDLKKETRPVAGGLEAVQPEGAVLGG
jgi:DNA replication and repair protein RecF